MEEKDRWEEIIQSKLKDFEVDTLPDDWKAIEGRLPGKRVVFARKWYYAAAVMALFLLITGGYFYFTGTGEKAGIVLIGEIGEIGETGEVKQPLMALLSLKSIKALEPLPPPSSTTITSKNDLSKLPPLSKVQLSVNHRNPVSETFHSLKQLLKNNTEDIQYIVDASSLHTSKRTGKKWSIGAGGGSYSVSPNGGGLANLASSNDAMIRALNNGDRYMDTPVRRNDNFNDFLTSTSKLGSVYSATNISRDNIIHKKPISFGVGIGYALNERWTLQSGLVYSLLMSEWRASLDYQEKSKQQLHFVGIPLGISYKIAEWNKLRFYASTGLMAEWNVGGNIKTKYYYYEDNDYRTEKEFVRMKEMQWSVNARVGATYPVIKFVNAYVEGGANYYFKNHSSIETIRTDKPFHVSLQAGLRFGF